VAVQDPAQPGADRRELRLIQAALRVGGGVAAREQQRVPVPERHLQVLAQPENHRAGRLGPAGFHEAQVPGGDVGLDRQIQLAEPPPLAPFAVAAEDGRLRTVLGFLDQVPG
jgi:hypothetical protein